jgi:adenylate cyclase
MTGSTLSKEEFGGRRRLAAILAADIAGYSRLMAEDEDDAVRQLRAHQSFLLPMVETFGGRVIDTAGDGILAEFGSVVDAVRFSLEMQKELTERNATTDPHRRMEFRIGIHFGDVVSDGTRIYGDGINVAARLESVANAGGICLSDRVHEEVASKLTAQWLDIGEQELKNLGRPVRVFRWLASPADSSGTPAGATAPAGTDKPSLAVMPFVNLSGDPAQDYFVDGITQDIITTLSYWRWCPVIAHNSTLAYKGKGVRVTDIGRALGARYVLEGSVRKSGSHVRISTQLADASSGHQIWAHRYDADLSDVFELQERMATQIVGAIEPELERAEERRAVRKKPHNLTAWDLTLRALSEQGKYTREGHAASYDLLTQAAEADGTSSYALSMMALCRYHQAIFGWVDDRGRAYEEAFNLAMRAVNLDDADSLAHTMLGISLLWCRRQHLQAVEELKYAVGLNPSAAYTHHLLACVLEFSGYSREAIEHIKTVLRLDPHYRFKAYVLADLALSHISLGNFEEALTFADQALQLNPTYVRALQRRLCCLGHLGRLEDGKVAVDTLRQVQPGFCLAYVQSTYPFKRPEQQAMFTRGLERVGAIW